MVPGWASMAFHRRRQAPGAHGVLNRPVGIVPVSGGPIVELGPTPPVDGQTSPGLRDGTTLITLPSLRATGWHARQAVPTDRRFATWRRAER